MTKDFVSLQVLLVSKVTIDVNLVKYLNSFHHSSFTRYKGNNNDEICSLVFKYYLVLSKVGGIEFWYDKTRKHMNRRFVLKIVENSVTLSQTIP